MDKHLGLRPKPEEEELYIKRQELIALESQLVERELQLIGLKSELGNFEREYLRRVGRLYAELDEIEAQLAESRAENHPQDAKARSAAQEARARAEESRAGTTELAVQDKSRSGASSALKNLYREVARRIHPDLALNDADRTKRQSLMAQANLAYERGDEAALQRILEEYERSPDSVLGEGAGAELVRVIRKIAQVKRRQTEIDGETDDLMRSDIHKLRTKVEDGTKQGRDILGEMALAVSVRIEQLKLELNESKKGDGSA